MDKTEFLTSDPNERGSINISGSDGPSTEKFKYLGLIFSVNGGLCYEIASCISATCIKSRSTIGVLWSLGMNERTKSKTYQSIVLPVAPYGFDYRLTVKDMLR